MKIERKQLLDRLTKETNASIAFAKDLQSIGDEKLNFKTNATTWSILECIEHLNLYAAFYLPEIEKAIRQNKTTKELSFKSGVLGNYFAKIMLPKEKLNKMKTFADKNPNGSNLDQSSLLNFIQNQEKLLHILKNSANIDLKQTKTAISMSKWIKLRLGDTFQFYSNHIIRHAKQIENTLEGIPK